MMTPDEIARGLTDAQRRAASEGRVTECPYNHPRGTRCPNCSEWPFKKGGAAAFISAVRQFIQDAQTKRETRWADTSDRACLMRKAADALDALLANWQPAPKPDRAEALAWMIEGLFAEAADNPCTCASDENSCPHCNAWERATKQTRACIVEAIDELRAEWEAERLEIPPHKHYSTPLIERLNGPYEWGYRDPVEGGFIADMSPFEASDRLSELEAERPAVVVPMSAKMWAESVLNLRGAINATCEREAARFILSLDGAKGDE